MRTDKMIETLISLGIAGAAVWAFVKFVLPGLSAKAAGSSGAAIARSGGCSGGVCYDDLLEEDTPQNAIALVQRSVNDGATPAGVGGILTNVAPAKDAQREYVLALSALETSRQRQLAQAAIGGSGGGGPYRDVVLSSAR